MGSRSEKSLECWAIRATLRSARISTSEGGTELCKPEIQLDGIFGGLGLQPPLQAAPPTCQPSCAQSAPAPAWLACQLGSGDRPGPDPQGSRAPGQPRW